MVKLITTMQSFVRSTFAWPHEVFKPSEARAPANTCQSNDHCQRYFIYKLRSVTSSWWGILTPEWNWEYNPLYTTVKMYNHMERLCDIDRLNSTDTTDSQPPPRPFETACWVCNKGITSAAFLETYYLVGLDTHVYIPTYTHKDT